MSRVAATDFENFAKTFAAGRPQIVCLTELADLDTPVSAFLKLADARPNSFLFESVEGGKTIGRYSFLGFDPDLVWRCNGQQAEINRNYQRNPTAFVADGKPALDSLRALVRACQFDLPAHLPPMAAGLVGYMGYETVRLMENISTQKPPPLGDKVPDGLFIRPTVTAIFDRIEDHITLSTTVWPTENQNAWEAYNTARTRLEQARADLRSPLPTTTIPATDHAENALPLKVESNLSTKDFHAMVERAKDYILAGDVFQVVLSQRFRLPFDLPPFALYRALRRINPSPFLFFMNFGHYSIVGSSPEILVRVRDGKVTIRPIAGTRKRGANATEDKELARDLLNDPKECAEHLMLLDLGRNDVGRVAQVGSVAVTERMAIELYSHVMHIVSNVDGVMDGTRADLIDALIAGFPAGTVSGAPKIRALEIIEELEPTRRGIYAGAVGYFGAGGGMDTCIALRTAVVNEGTITIQAGAGIVADSIPENEDRECHNKAQALIHAAEAALRSAATGQ